MNGPGDYHTTGVKSDRVRQAWYHLYAESKKMIHMNLFTTQRQTHRLRKQNYGYQRGKAGGGINREFGTDTHSLLYWKQITSKGLLFSSGGSTQYSANLRWEENFEKDRSTRVTESLCLHLKLTQHYKWTILQYEIKHVRPYRTSFPHLWWNERKEEDWKTHTSSHPTETRV